MFQLNLLTYWHSNIYIDSDTSAATKTTFIHIALVVVEAYFINFGHVISGRRPEKYA